MIRLYLLIPVALFSFAYSKTLSNNTCAACHPKIVKEYKDSIHANSSIYTDAIHKAIWDKHPDKAKNNYECAKCHTPSDHDLVNGQSTLSDNKIQRNEPVSCQTCHQIESIEKHKQSNSNKYINKKKYFYSSDKHKRGSKLIFHKESSFFGLITKTFGSPYHDIDYSNEIYYNGDMCMGCHSHKKNSGGFTICDLEVDQRESDQTCISCHIPQKRGSFSNLASSKTHAFHGISIRNGTPKHLSGYIDLNLTTNPSGFEIAIHNHATHALFTHSLRMGQLRVSIEHEGKINKLEPVVFRRSIGSDGKPTMPWLADTVLNDTTIKAHEIRSIPFSVKLHKGDKISIEFGYYIINPKIAEELGIKTEKKLNFITLTKKLITL